MSTGVTETPQATEGTGLFERSSASGTNLRTIGHECQSSQVSLEDRL